MNLLKGCLFHFFQADITGLGEKKKKKKAGVAAVA